MPESARWPEHKRPPHALDTSTPTAAPVPRPATRSIGGSTDTYNYSNYQTVNYAGTVSYNTGRTVNLSTFPSNTEYNLGNVAAPGEANAAIFDAPGLALTSPLGTVASASFTRNFTLNLTVSNGSETAICPQVKWSVTMTWFSVDGNVIASGGASVSTPYTPNPGTP